MKFIRLMLDHLAKLIAFDTQNPPGGDTRLIDYLFGQLQNNPLARPDRLERVDVVPGRHGYLCAIYGTPRKLINVHCDTVPANAGWHFPPFELTLKDGRAYGLGSADTKGNIAVLLHLLTRMRPQNAMLLFSGDEENACSSCVRAFLQSPLFAHIQKAVVCEPTASRLGVSHRGFARLHLSCRGSGGHSSRVDEIGNPLVDLCRAAVFLDDVGKKYRHAGKAPFYGLCLNVGRIAGGISANVIPSQVDLEASLRPPPDFDQNALLAEIEQGLNRQGLPCRLEKLFNGAAFQTTAVQEFRAAFGDGFAGRTHLDFWTEAALFEQNGVNSVVYGPGDVCQAHAPDEFVSIADLERAGEVYARFLAEA